MLLLLWFFFSTADTIFPNGKGLKNVLKWNKAFCNERGFMLKNKSTCELCVYGRIILVFFCVKNTRRNSFVIAVDVLKALPIF